MKRSHYTNYDQLPLFLNAELVSKTLGIAPSSAYELMHEKNFPTLRIGSRMVVPKDKFIEWVVQHTQFRERSLLAATGGGQRARVRRLPFRQGVSYRRKYFKGHHTLSSVLETGSKASQPLRTVSVGKAIPHG